jgi:hypothetical protein
MFSDSAIMLEAMTLTKALRQSRASHSNLLARHDVSYTGMYSIWGDLTPQTEITIILARHAQFVPKTAVPVVKDSPQQADNLV